MELISLELQMWMWRVWLPWDPSVSKSSSSGLPWGPGSDTPGAAQPGVLSRAVPLCCCHIWGQLGMLGQIPSPGTGISSSQGDCGQLLSGVLPADTSSCSGCNPSLCTAPPGLLLSPHTKSFISENMKLPNKWNFLISLVPLTEVFSFEDQFPVSLKHSQSVSLKLFLHFNLHSGVKSLNSAVLYPLEQKHQFLKSNTRRFPGRF